MDVYGVHPIVYNITQFGVHQFHGLTGCNTTSYFFRIGKVRVFKKLMKKCSKLELLDSLRRKEELDEDDFADIKEFIRTVLYSGNPTRITLVLEYEFMKI